MTDETTAAYQAIIADLEAEIETHRREIARHNALADEARNALSALRRRLAATTTSGFLVLAPPTPSPAAANAERPRRGEVSAAVLDTIRSQPGITGRQLADILAANLESPALDKRKLAYSTVSYLIHKGLVRRTDRGLFVNEHDAQRDDSRDDEAEEFPF